MGERFSQHWWNDVTFRVFLVSIWAVCVISLFEPAADQYLMRFTGLDIPQLMWAGAAFMVLGFGLAVAANFSLGKQWRSGVDSTATQQLVSHGLYNISRNPAYVGVAIAQAGFFMALPSLSGDGVYSCVAGHDQYSGWYHGLLWYCTASVIVLVVTV